MINFCYEFGRAVAHFHHDEFDMSSFAHLCSTIGLTAAQGSNGQRDAMIGAFDEYKRLRDIREAPYESQLDGIEPESSDDSDTLEGVL